MILDDDLLRASLVKRTFTLDADNLQNLHRLIYTDLQSDINVSSIKNRL